MIGQASNDNDASSKQTNASKSLYKPCWYQEHNGFVCQGCADVCFKNRSLHSKCKNIEIGYCISMNS